jgi:hypothetical protein
MTPKMLKEFYRSGQLNKEVASRKERFAALNELVSRRPGAWLTCVPGEADVTLECLPDSTIPAELRALRYHVRETGEGQRILPHAIVQQFVTRADGEFEPLTEESTRPISSTRTHAGICKVKRYSFTSP